MNSRTLASRPASGRASSNWLVSAAVAAAIAGSMAAPTVRAADSANSADQELATVTVTGSRIARRDFDAPSPVVTVSTECL